MACRQCIVMDVVGNNVAFTTVVRNLMTADIRDLRGDNVRCGTRILVVDDADAE